MFGLQHRLPKPAAKLSCVSSKRCVRVTVAAIDPAAHPTSARQDDCLKQKDAGPVAACISAIAAQLIVSSAAWADVPMQELFSVQAAQPLTELSSDASPEEPAAPAEVAPPVLSIAAAEEPTAASEAIAAPALSVAAAAEEAAAPVAMVAMDVAAVANADAVAEVDIPAEPAVASPVIAMDIPAMPTINADTDVRTLVAALIRNEQFISALVNNEAFLDRLAGEDKVVEELARRKGLSVEIEARDELATELRRRQQMMDALAARGEEAVLAVADAAQQAAKAAAAAARDEIREADASGEVGVVSSGKSALVAMGTAVELLEDSQELLAAVEANPGVLPQKEVNKMEAAVARAEKSVSTTLEKSGNEPLPVLQEAVRELYAGGEQQQNVEAGADAEPTINHAYKDLVTAVAEMQRAYGSAISKAVGHAVAEVVEVEEAALQGAEKTKVVLGQKVDDLEKAVGFNPAPPRSGAAKQKAAAASKAETAGPDAPAAAPLAAEQGEEAPNLTLPVGAAFAFWFWGTFILPRTQYSR